MVDCLDASVYAALSSQLPALAQIRTVSSPVVSAMPLTLSTGGSAQDTREQVWLSACSCRILSACRSFVVDAAQDFLHIPRSGVTEGQEPQGNMPTYINMCACDLTIFRAHGRDGDAHSPAAEGQWVSVPACGRHACSWVLAAAGRRCIVSFSALCSGLRNGTSIAL